MKGLVFMLICFESQSGSNGSVYVELARTVSPETVKKLEMHLDRIIEKYSEANNGDFYGFNIYDAITKVMNTSKLKWRFPCPDVTIYY